MKKGKLGLEIFGWYGVAAIFGAYVLVSFQVIAPNSIIYQALNLTGGLGIVAESFYKKNFQPAVLNTIWSVVALIALLSVFFQAA